MNLALRKISWNDFLKEMNLNDSMIEEYTLVSLENGYKEQDADAIEYTLYFGYKIACVEKFVNILCKLIVADWHITHENIAMLLQRIKSPNSIDCLVKAILAANKLEYLSYNNSEAFIRKCCFALGDINTTRSQNALITLSTSNSPIIRNAAKEQIQDVG